MADIGDVPVRSVRRSVRWHRAACATALGGVALAGCGGGMSSWGATLGKEPGPGPRWQWGVSFRSPVVRVGVCPGHIGQAALPGR